MVDRSRGEKIMKNDRIRNKLHYETIKMTRRVANFKVIFSFMLLGFISLQTSNLYSQVVSIVNLSNENGKLYLGMPNRLKVSIKNYPLKSIVVSTNNGRLTVDNLSQPDIYCIDPRKMSNSTVYVHLNIKGKRKLLDSFVYDIERVPVRYLEDHGEYDLSSLLFYGINGVTIKWRMLDGALPIDSVLVNVIRNEKLIYSKQFGVGFSELNYDRGVMFDSETEDFFTKSLQKGDVIQYKNIKIRDFDNTLRKLDDVEVYFK